MNSRRTFVLGAGSALAANVVTRMVSASDKIRIAVPGVNGRGKDQIKGFRTEAWPTSAPWSSSTPTTSR